MRQLLERSFTVAATPEVAWAALVDADAWPSWAHHIQRIELTPPGRVEPSTEAVIVLTNRTKASVAVTDFDPGRRFLWQGRFLWMGLAYDHTIQPADGGTRITFTVEASGPGAASIGRLFARIYGRNLDCAIPNLQAQLDHTHPLSEGAIQ